MSPQTPEDVFGKVQPSGLEFFNKYGPGRVGLGNFLTALINVIYILGAIFLILMLLWGAIDWITSGGEKDKVEAARNKITHAIIGFIIMAITVAILAVVGTFTGIQFFSIPST